MGIEINPEGDYGDPAFIAKSEASLKKVLGYSRNYDCIITYLILNEPQTDHIHKVTSKGFLALMQRLMDAIHKAHPGIPVTISANAMISDYLDENIFDVYAYNCYDHLEAQTATMGLKDYIRGLVELNGSKKPLIITEFGYSISRRGEGRYGGNTLAQQRDGLVANYRDLIDAGAAGMCPFYYADGWWKGGDPSTHNADQPEEWFGFWGYRDASDRFGSPRPVWFALRDYMKALIISPKNNTIYTANTIPLELYTDKEVRRVVVKHNDKEIYSKNLVADGYLGDQLTLAPDGIEDMELAFEFYDANNRVVKTEPISILASSAPFELPKLLIEVTPDNDLNAATNASIKTTIQTQDAFKIAGDLKVSFNTHLGWKVGPQVSMPLKGQAGGKIITTERAFAIPANCWVVNASAGLAIRRGKFVFRIHDQKLVYRGDWAKDIARNKTSLKQ